MNRPRMDSKQCAVAPLSLVQALLHAVGDGAMLADMVTRIESTSRVCRPPPLPLDTTGAQLDPMTQCSCLKIFKVGFTASSGSSSSSSSSSSDSASSSDSRSPQCAPLLIYKVRQPKLRKPSSVQGAAARHPATACQAQ